MADTLIEVEIEVLQTSKVLPSGGSCRMEFEPFHPVHGCSPQTGCGGIVTCLTLNPAMLDPAGTQGPFVLFEPSLCAGHHADRGQGNVFLLQLTDSFCDNGNLSFEGRKCLYLGEIAVQEGTISLIVVSATVKIDNVTVFV